ncbi:rhodanese-like domain-containing protein [Uliginosibacterium sediminicola]|uniref:Rhodanese-like domain-containing protein n=1 Tax=Uliginosibacterium sediminicola TaxID=2024550 RepID=A0ABU9Z069_9RHOO
MPMRLLIALLFACLSTLACARSVLIDVRTPEEYAAGHIEGALNIDHAQIAQRVGTLGVQKADELLLYCRSGRRSAIAQQSLKQLGYTKVID